MELINNRYRIVRPISQNKLATAYLVEDLWDGNKELQLSLLDSRIMSHSMTDYFSREFIRISSLDNKYLLGDYHFNRLTHINNRKNNEIQYFYASEYLEGIKQFSHYWKDMTFDELIESFIAVCRAVTYLHLKGHAYENLDVGNMLYDKKSGITKLKSLATVRLENHLNMSEDGASHLLGSVVSLPNREQGSKTDLYDLGVLLLSLLRKTSILPFPEKELKALETETRDETSKVARIIPIIRELLQEPRDIKFNHVREVIEELNERLNTNYKVINPRLFEQLNFHTRLVNQEEIFSEIDARIENVSNPDLTKKTILVDGGIGLGKTRLLQEIEFLYSLKGIDVYSAFTLGNSNANNSRFWISILRKLMMDCDVEVYEEYAADLKAYFPELADKGAFNRESSRKPRTNYQIVERIASFIRDSIQDRLAIFLIDNIHLASDFTLKLLLTVSKMLQKGNAILILTYSDLNKSSSSSFKEFVGEHVGSEETTHIELKKLTERDTGKLIKDILSISYTPVKFGERIHAMTEGNPLFIVEMLKDLRSRKVIHIDKLTGFWKIDLPEPGKYESMLIPSSIGQVMMNQMAELDDKLKSALEQIAIYSSPKSLEFWVEVLGIPADEMSDIIQELINQNILTVVIDDEVALYGFKNEMLRGIFNEQLTVEVKEKKHKQAALILEKQADVTLYDEMIYHFERSNQFEKVKYYSLKNADEMRHMNDIDSMFRNLKKALANVYDDKEKPYILLEIADRYLERDQKDDTYIYLKQAEELIGGSDDKELMVNLYLRLAESETYRAEFEFVDGYLEKARALLKDLPIGGNHFIYKRIKALGYVYKGKTEKAAELCLEIIDQATELDEVIVASAKQLLAYTYTYGLNKTEEAIGLYEEAIAVYKKREYMRELIYSLNNLAVIYLEHRNELDTALEKFKELNDLSVEYDYITGRVFSLINLGVIYATQGKLEKAFISYKEALEKTKTAKGIKNNKPFLYSNLIRVSLDLNLFDQADSYLREFEADYSMNKYPEINHVQKYLGFSRFYYAMGMYEEANVYDNKILKSGMDKEQPLFVYAQMYEDMYQIRMKAMGEAEKEVKRILESITFYQLPEYSVEVLLDFGIMLYEHKDFENIKKANEVIEKLMLEIEVPTKRITARYHFLRGLVAERGSWEEEFLESLQHAKEELEFTAIVMMELAKGYIHSNRFHLGANYYLEAGSILKILINRIPDKYKLVYVNSKAFATVFYRVNELEGVILRGEDIELSTDKVPKRVDSLKQLKELMRGFNTNAFTENERFMDIIQHDYRKHISHEFIDVESIIANLSSNSLKNIEMLLNHLAAKTISNRGYVAIETEDEDFEVLASNYTGKIQVNQQVLRRVKRTARAISLDLEEEVESRIINGVKRALYVPIIGSNYYNKATEQDLSNDEPECHHQIIGYLCLESDKSINNLTEQAINAETSLLNLLALLMEMQQLKLAASIDKITGALTRKYLEDSLLEHMNQEAYSGKTFSVIMCDIDRFKRINDRYGHLVGDEVLHKLSGFIMRELGGRGVLGRYGGEEFVIILRDTDLSQAMDISEELRKKISMEKFLNNDVVITVSLGVVSSKQAETMADFLGKADQALYVAKETGRNKSIAWDNKYRNYVQQTTNLTEIMTGDEIQDSRNILAFVELIELMNQKIPLEEKVHEFLGRAIEVSDAQLAYLFFIEEGKVTAEYKRGILQTEQTENLTYNQQLLETTIMNGEPNYVVDWGDLETTNLQISVPDWHSNLIVPIKFQDKLLGVIYLVASARVKEFSMKELNIINVLSNIAVTIVR